MNKDNRLLIFLLSLNALFIGFLVIFVLFWHNKTGTIGSWVSTAGTFLAVTVSLILASRTRRDERDIRNQEDIVRNLKNDIQILHELEDEVLEIKEGENKLPDWKRNMVSVNSRIESDALQGVEEMQIKAAYDFFIYNKAGIKKQLSEWIKYTININKKYIFIMDPSLYTQFDNYIFYVKEIKRTMFEVNQIIGKEGVYSVETAEVNILYDFNDFFDQINKLSVTIDSINKSILDINKRLRETSNNS